MIPGFGFWSWTDGAAAVVVKTLRTWLHGEPRYRLMATGGPRYRLRAT